MKRTYLVATFLTIATVAAFSAGFSIPDLEMSTLGSTQDGTFALRSRSYIDMLFEGGYKFGGRVKLNVNSGDFEDALALSKQQATSANVVDKLNNSTYLTLKQVSVSVKDAFSLPLNLTYFLGDMENFGTGDDFPTTFGTTPIATTLRGFSYFPDGIGGDPNRFYDGIYGVSGTGIELSTPVIGDRFVPSLYAYQDSNLGLGKYSVDARGVLNLADLKLDFFAGCSYPYRDLGLYRLGMLFYYNTGSVGEFFAQIGLPYLNPSIADPLSIDNFYFLFEPRLNFGLVHIIATFFKHPAYYMQQATNETGKMDVNFNLQFGDLETGTVRGGIESTISFDSQTLSTDSSQFTLKVSPYVSMVTSGVRWDVKLSVLPLKYSTTSEMFQPYLGVRAGF